MPHDSHSHPDEPPIAAAPSTGQPLRLDTPMEIVAAVPQLLGFTPASDLVAIMIRDRMVAATARLDLPPLRSVNGVWPALANAVAGTKADAVVLIVYGGRDADAVLAECIRRSPIRVLHGLLVHKDRLWVPTCTSGPQCCPPGAKIDPERISVLAPILVHAGVAVASSRAALSACLQPAADDVRERVSSRLRFFTQQATGRLTQRNRYDELNEARKERAEGSMPISELQAARLLYCLSDQNVRDACACFGDGGWSLWLDLIPLTPPSHVALVAALIGIHAFQRGDGAMAVIAAQHALSASPGYSFAELIIELTQSGIPPLEATTELQIASREVLAALAS